MSTDPLVHANTFPASPTAPYDQIWGLEGDARQRPAGKAGVQKPKRPATHVAHPLPQQLGDAVLGALHCDSSALFGIVTSRFNYEIGEAMRIGCVAELHRLGVGETRIQQLSVPGALEIPIALQKLALQQKYHALIAIGVVVRGETYHFELVANEASAGITRIALDFSTPIVNAVLTTENMGQAWARVEKGEEAARVAVEMANLIGPPN